MKEEGMEKKLLHWQWLEQKLRNEDTKRRRETRLINRTAEKRMERSKSQKNNKFI